VARLRPDYHSSFSTLWLLSRVHSGPVGLTGTNLTNLITVGLSETPGEAANGLGGLPGCLLRLIGGLSRSLLGLT
jgi:hypothetical protein